MNHFRQINFVERVVVAVVVLATATLLPFHGSRVFAQDPASDRVIVRDLSYTIAPRGNALIYLRRDAGVFFNNIPASTISISDRSNPALNSEVKYWTGHNGNRDVVQYLTDHVGNACSTGHDSFTVTYQANKEGDPKRYDVTLRVHITITDPNGGNTPHGYTAFKDIDIGYVAPGATVADIVLLDATNGADDWGHPVEIVSVSADRGTATIADDGRSIAYTAPAAETGPVLIEYTVAHRDAADDRGDCRLSATGYVRGTVADHDYPAVSLTDTVVAGQPVTVDVLPPDAADSWGHRLSVTAARLGPDVPGAVAFTPTSVTYSAPANFTGTATVLFDIGHADAADDAAAGALASGGVLTVAVVPPPRSTPVPTPPPSPSPSPSPSPDPGADEDERDDETEAVIAPDTPEAGADADDPEPTPDEADTIAVPAPEADSDLPFTGGNYGWPMLAGLTLVGLALAGLLPRQRRTNAYRSEI